MSSLVVVGDSVVNALLIGLTRPETLDFQRQLSSALRRVSVQGEDGFQPEPGVVNRADGQKVLFRAFTSPELVGTKIIVDAAPVPDADGVPRRAGLRGMLSLVDAAGLPRGLVNAAGVTAYRTSLCALIPYVWRRDTARILVFGAGKQALWHTRLALALRGPEIRSIVVVNRSEASARALIDTVQRDREEQGWQSPAEIGYVSTEDAALKPLLAESDVIFCTVPSTEPIFALDDVLGRGEGQTARKSNPLITAIGSWQPQMIELDPALLRYAAEKEGAILADNRHEARNSTGEGIQSALKDEQIIEVGQVLDWKAEDSVSEKTVPADKLEEWTSTGFTVYKSVGVSVTDLVSGDKILELARAKGLGTVVDGF